MGLWAASFDRPVISSRRERPCVFSSWERELLNVEMFLWWPYTHTCTHAHTSVSHVLALSLAWCKQDGARSNWTGPTSNRKPRRVSRSSSWLCAFDTLAYWILAFCFWGFFLIFQIPVCPLGSERWTIGTKLDLRRLRNELLCRPHLAATALTSPPQRRAT